MPVRIAVDVAGGDAGASVTLPAVARFLGQHASAQCVLAGDPARISDWLDRQPSLVQARVQILPATQTITMDEPPLEALRGKPDASMRVALEALAESTVDACLSAGNTGALVTLGHVVLKPIPGVERPVLCAALPSMHGVSLLLDVGAGVDATDRQLVQFAAMGTILAQHYGYDRPRVALLNVGHEAIKGTGTVKAAARRLEADDDFVYVGFVEGDALFAGLAEVIVCDGFSGNIALKAGEGVARLVADRLVAVSRQNAVTRGLAMLAAPLLRRVRRELDPGRLNGACVLGLQGLVVKSHGAATVEAFTHALHRTATLAEKGLMERLQRGLAQPSLF